MTSLIKTPIVGVVDHFFRNDKFDFFLGGGRWRNVYLDKNQQIVSEKSILHSGNKENTPNVSDIQTPSSNQKNLIISKMMLQDSMKSLTRHNVKSTQTR